MIRERAGLWKAEEKDLEKEKNADNVQKVIDTGFYL